MKRWVVVAMCVIGVAGTATAVIMRVTRPPEVTISITDAGLTSLKADKVEYLDNGNFVVEQITLRKPSGETYRASSAATQDVNPERQEVTKSYLWGKVKTNYLVSKNKLTLKITTTNASTTDTIQGVRYTPFSLRFPDKLKEYDGNIPLLANNLGEVAMVKTSWSTGTMAIVSEDIDKPLMIGFPWALDRPANLRYPLDVNIDRVESFPDSFPTIKRRIPPGGSDTFVVSLRFGRANATESALIGDMSKRFAEAFPMELKWTDHRPIGAIFLASQQEDWATNPRGWLQNPRLNIHTPHGLAELRQGILSLADSSIQIMRDMNAQGALTWDPEGQEFAKAINYAGDPRMVDTLAPEMSPILDEYFDRFIKAGVRVGICVRPQQLTLAADHKSWVQKPVDDPAALLMEKIAYAKKRWGATIFYLSGNTNAADPNPIDPNIVQKVAEAFPDCLLLAEHSTLRYYAYAVPYCELRQGSLGTPASVRETYPKAFSLIYTVDGPLDLYKDGLSAAVKKGDMVMYRTWFADPQNEKVKSLYAR
jgi:hypothetical protein